ncbi:hypothetical protein [Ramlibacter sp. PS4R-6]|uniref:hypothetical protein n=1 Tax=Ramlibacter sp. PS4R-6 TaxID=3133438 RepID=UPI0030B45BA8
MAAPNPSLITWLVLVPLIAWRMVVRFRRLTQRQKLSRVRPWVTLTLFPLLLWLLAMTAFVPPGPPQPFKLVWLAAGLAIGGALAVYGLKRTQFEAIPGDGLYYTPDARLGIALSALFVARLAWRLGELALHGTDASQGPQFVLSPWTLAPVGMFSGYFMAYAAGLLLWRRKVLRRKRENG